MLYSALVVTLQIVVLLLLLLLMARLIGSVAIVNAEYLHWVQLHKALQYSLSCDAVVYLIHGHRLAQTNCSLIIHTQKVSDVVSGVSMGLTLTFIISLHFAMQHTNPCESQTVPQTGTTYLSKSLKLFKYTGIKSPDTIQSNPIQYQHVSLLSTQRYVTPTDQSRSVHH